MRCMIQDIQLIEWDEHRSDLEEADIQQDPEEYTAARLQLAKESLSTGSFAIISTQKTLAPSKRSQSPLVLKHERLYFRRS